MISSFLSFSFRFFLLQILRFTMRDWLSLPSTLPNNPSPPVKERHMRTKCITHYEMDLIEEEEEVVMDMKRSLSISSMTSMDSDLSQPSKYIEQKVRNKKKKCVTCINSFLDLLESRWQKSTGYRRICQLVR